METTELTLRSLHLLSPGLADDFQQQMESAVMDCRQRPSLSKSREITIKLTITPHPEDPDDVLIQPVDGTESPFPSDGLAEAKLVAEMNGHAITLHRMEGHRCYPRTFFYGVCSRPDCRLALEYWPRPKEGWPHGNIYGPAANTICGETA